MESKRKPILNKIRKAREQSMRWFLQKELKNN
jgi:hypothetical protein